ncbi:MAG TPA: glycosyltransferase family 4 protein, partial [Stellaceae bacterium]|nr:glycosyltransferase family 4 protein [Stellaceae bacterium]
QTSATLEPGCERALRLSGTCRDPLAHHLVMLYRVRQRAGEFDILHLHTDYLHFPLFADLAEKTVTTLHGRLDVPDLPVIMREFPTMPLVSISQAQQAPIPWANWRGTVLHGLPGDLHRAGSGAGGYLAFLGRISPEKGADRAIAIARRAGLPLQIAAKVDRQDEEYYAHQVAPLLNDPLIEYVGEIGEADKGAFLGDALALLFPIDWPEPFGLVLIEAMATGTPVIAFRRGAVPEIVEDGLTGFIVDDVAGAAAALQLVPAMDRAAIRRRFEERFTAPRMAQDYLALYRSQLSAAAGSGYFAEKPARRTIEAAE